MEKQYGNIKARTCAYGTKQRSANNSVMITSALEAKEGRGVAIIDIPGTYLHTYVDKHGKQRIIMLFKRKFE